MRFVLDSDIYRNSVQVGVLIISLAICGPVVAEMFYSVEVLTDELVQIDSTNGQVTVIGALGRDVKAADLTIFQGELYLVNSDIQAQRAELLRINITTGQAAVLGDLSMGPDRVTHAEGVDERRDELTD